MNSTHRLRQLRFRLSLQAEDVVQEVHKLLAATPLFSIGETENLVCGALLSNLISGADTAVSLLHAAEEDKAESLQISIGRLRVVELPAAVTFALCIVSSQSLQTFSDLPKNTRPVRPHKRMELVEICSC